MAKSLADQLLGAGLVDDKKVKQHKQQKRKNKKHKIETSESVEQQARLEQQRAAHAERDRELNRQRKAAEEQKAMQAQVRQMLQQNRQKVDGEIRFNFADRHSKKIKHVYVSSRIQDQLAKGLLAICLDGETYAVVPANIADKIAERFPEALIFLADRDSNVPDEDDPYKDFPIPDDITW